MIGAWRRGEQSPPRCACRCRAPRAKSPRNRTHRLEETATTVVRHREAPCPRPLARGGVVPPIRPSVRPRRRSLALGPRRAGEARLRAQRDGPASPGLPADGARGRRSTPWEWVACAALRSAAAPRVLRSRPGARERQTRDLPARTGGPASSPSRRVIDGR